MVEIEQKSVKSEMQIYDVFDNLVTAPTGAVIVYKLTYNDIHGVERDRYIAVLDDGDTEMVWGVGVDMTDALQSADREYKYWYSHTPFRHDNPFSEILKSLKCT